MNDVAGGQCFISIVLRLEFSPSVLSRLASSLFTFGGQALGPRSRSEARLCRERRRDSRMKLSHAAMHQLISEGGPASRRKLV